MPHNNFIAAPVHHMWSSIMKEQKKVTKLDKGMYFKNICNSTSSEEQIKNSLEN